MFDAQVLLDTRRPCVHTLTVPHEHRLPREHKAPGYRVPRRLSSRVFGHCIFLELDSGGWHRPSLENTGATPRAGRSGITSAMGWKICHFVLYVDAEGRYFPGFLERGRISLNQRVVGSTPTGSTLKLIAQQSFSASFCDPLIVRSLVVDSVVRQ